MFKIWLTNFGYFAKDGRSFASLNEAISVGKSLGFEFAVRDNHGFICSWSPIGGMRQCM